jgi:mono/diheme cytochrome c family protein
MPVFDRLSDGDVEALIAYVRTAPAVSKPSRLPELTILGRVVFALAAKPAHAVPKGVEPPPAAKLGEYLANEVCRCSDCHHPRVQHEPVAGKLWSGGFRLDEPGLPPVLSANVTPDEVEGIGRWTKDQFLRAVREGTTPASRKLHEAMPRYPLTDADAGAVFDYLRAQPPVRSHIWSQDALRGCELYASAGCASCHGLDGKGPRADITKAGASGDIAKIKTWIKDPAAVKPGTLMPKMSIESESDLEALAHFVVELSQHPN